MDCPQTAVKAWLFEAIQKGWLLLPPPICVYDAIVSATEDIQQNCESVWNPSGYVSALNQTWRWTSTPGRGLLLYAVREYLQKYFGGYDPTDTVWNEENCPWDYDHIFPQAWLRGSGRTGHGAYHKLVEKFLNSIGNIAPIPFSVNRGKSDDVPGEYQKGDNELLLVNSGEVSQINPEQKSLEDDEIVARCFAKITAERLKAIYSAWYNTLEIGKLLTFSSSDFDLRHRLFAKIMQADPMAKYACPYGLDHFFLNDRCKCP